MHNNITTGHKSTITICMKRIHSYTHCTILTWLKWYVTVLNYTTDKQQRLSYPVPTSFFFYVYIKLISFYSFGSTATRCTTLITVTQSVIFHLSLSNNINHTHCQRQATVNKNTVKTKMACSHKISEQTMTCIWCQKANQILQNFTQKKVTCHENLSYYQQLLLNSTFQIKHNVNPPKYNILMQNLWNCYIRIFFTVQMHFLLPHQHCHSSDGQNNTNRSQNRSNTIIANE